MTQAEIQVKINLARREIKFWEDILADKRCGNCTQYQQDICRKYQAAPPNGSKEPGCDDWSWDQIPF